GRDGEEPGRAAGPLWQPVLRRHRRRRGPDAGLRPARPGDERLRRRPADRAAREPIGPADRPRRDPAGHNRVRLMAKVRVGDTAPEFELEGTGSRSYSLASYRGAGVIVAFYPGDFTPVCTRQFCSYRDDGDRIEALGIAMVGISPQSVASHESFAELHGLTVPLLSDPGKLVAHSYGVVGPGGFVRRSVFLIDGDGVVRYRQVALFGLRYQD